MVELNGVNYYTISELTEMMLYEDAIIKNLYNKMQSVYGYFNVSLGFMQSKLYPAKDKRQLKYIQFQKKGPVFYNAFAIEDIMDFLDKPCARHIQQSKYRNIKVFESK